MSNATYKIVINQAHGLVDLRMEGMLSVDDTDMLVDELIAKLTDARLASFGMIVDVSRCPVQSREMVAAMTGHMARMQNARALAIVTGAALAHLQVRRIFQQSFARFTASYEEARQWVLFGVEPVASGSIRSA